MTQDQYLTLRKHRPVFDHWAASGVWRPAPDTVNDLEKMRQDLFGKHTNWWCGGCVKEALYELYSAYDVYVANFAPVILNPDQKAVVDGRDTKAANKRKRG